MRLGVLRKAALVTLAGCVLASVLTLPLVFAGRGAAVRPRPSYQQGFARSPAESDRPQDWDGLIYFSDPHLGVTGAVLPDWSRYGYNAPLSNMELSDWFLDPAYGPALVFDGANERVVLPDLYRAAGQYTLMVYVRVDGGGARHDPMLSLGFDFSGDQGLLIKTDDSTKWQLLLGNDFTSGAGVPSGPADTWHLFAGTCDMNTGETVLYLNGDEIHSETLDTGPGFVSGSTAIAADLNSTEDGRVSIGQVRIYNRILSAREMRDIYEDIEGIARRREGTKTGIAALVEAAVQVVQPGPFWW